MFGLFERRLEPFPETRATRPPGELAAFCWHYVKDARWWLLAVAVLAAGIAIGEVLLFGFLGSIVDWLSSEDPEGFLERQGATLFAMGALVVLILPLAHLAWSLVFHQTLIGNLPMSARWRMHRWLLGQSLGFFANEFAGRVATKVMQTSLAVRETVMKLLDVFVYVVVFFISMVALLAAADIRLVIPLAVWTAAYAGMIWYFVPRLGKIAELQADARSAMTGRVVDSYTNIQTVKLFAHAGREESYARESMDSFLQTVHPQMRLVTLFQALVYTANCALILAIAAMGIGFWMRGETTAGALAVGVSLALRINGMSQWIMWEVSALFENIGVMFDGMKMLTVPRDVVDDADAEPLATAEGALRFEDVCFHYGKSGGVIEGLTLDIKPGEKIGLVGRSGAGKTTLVNLVLRFFDVERGRVLLDGRDIRTLSQDALRAQIGMVTQDTSLLHRSIRENIAYGRPEATDAEILDAAGRANALDFIHDLADKEGRSGLDAHVGERGVKLSGGQRQRIAIARIFLKDAPILVLDEATSALDSEVEAAIQDSLFALMEGKTVIAIAHRLSTIAAMDRLVVLDKGCIIEQGAHEDLVAAGGLYAELWARQSGGFLTEPAKAQAAE